MRVVSIFLACLTAFPWLLTSCTNAPFRGDDVVGADEFVMDSYKIREGKFSVLELQGKSLPPLPAEYLEPYKDTIHEGDVLNILTYHPTRNDITESVIKVSQMMGFPVREGAIILPEIGKIEVLGLTLVAAQEKIQQTYHMKDLDVFLSYKSRSEDKVELAGLIGAPNIPVDGKMRLFDLLSIGRVPSNANFFKSYVIRSNELIAVDMYRLIKEGDMSQNIVMRGGDKVYIAEPSASTLMVLGEVNHEAVIEVPNGFVTLGMALAAGGGIAQTGDRAYIQVIRGTLIQPKIYTLNWQHVLRLPSDSLLLIPGDIVYVASTPLTDWNRFVNLILPTIMGAEALTKKATELGINLPGSAP